MLDLEEKVSVADEIAVPESGLVDDLDTSFYGSDGGLGALIVIRTSLSGDVNE